MRLRATAFNQDGVTVVKFLRTVMDDPHSAPGREAIDAAPRLVYGAQRPRHC